MLDFGGTKELCFQFPTALTLRFHPCIIFSNENILY